MNIRIPLFKPDLGSAELEEIYWVFDANWPGLGKKTAEFEEMFSQYLNRPCVALNSCTAALDIAVRLVGVGPGDEVIVPTITFVSTAHAVEYNQGKVVFCDVDPDTLLMDIDSLDRLITPRTKAIIPVHYSGRMVDIVKIKDKTNVAVVEDCAHAAGSRDWFGLAGELGDYACFSFHAVKNISCGDGGMLAITTTKEEVLAKQTRWLGIDSSTWDRTLGERPRWEYDVTSLGQKSHMNDIQAAIGLVQLKRLDCGNNNRRRIANLYLDGLEDLEQVRLPPRDTDRSKSSWHIFPIQVDESKRDALCNYLADNGIQTGVHYKPVHLFTYYKEKTPGLTLPNAEMVWKRLLSLPVYITMTDSEVYEVVEHIHNFFRK